MNQNLSDAAMNWGRKEQIVNIGQFSWSNNAYPDEKINHKEDIEAKVDLLCFILRPGNTSLNRVAVKKIRNIKCFDTNINFKNKNWTLKSFCLPVGVNEVN